MEDFKKLVLGNVGKKKIDLYSSKGTKKKKGNWGIAGYQFKKVKGGGFQFKKSNKPRKPLIDIKMGKGEKGATNVSIDYPETWFGGKKKTRSKATPRTKTTVRDVTNEYTSRLKSGTCKRKYNKRRK